MKDFFNKQFNIKDRIISKVSPVFIIAEAGVNHNGNIKKAFKLIDIAKKAGADAIKFQTFNTEFSTVKNLKKAKYQKNDIKDKETQFDMLKKLELDYNSHLKIKNYCRKKKIIFFSTPSDTKSVDILEKINVPCYKISSVDLNNCELLKRVCKTKKPVIISTGMSNIEDILETSKFIKKFNNKKIIFLHCVSAYPSNILHLNLNSINFLKKKLNAMVGFSDHSTGYEASILAVASGARVIEKHFTINKNLKGPDHKISMNYVELKKMIEKIRKTEKIMGKYSKEIHKSEMNTLEVTKKVFTAKKDIKAGKYLSLNMLNFKSGGKGFSFKEIKLYLGKKIKKHIKKNTVIKKNYFYEK